MHEILSSPTRNAGPERSLLRSDNNADPGLFPAVMTLCFDQGIWVLPDHTLFKVDLMAFHNLTFPSQTRPLSHLTLALDFLASCTAAERLCTSPLSLRASVGRGTSSGPLTIPSLPNDHRPHSCLIHRNTSCNESSSVPVCQETASFESLPSPGVTPPTSSCSLATLPL